MSIDEPTLQEFVRHAERYGSELVYETALGYLEPEDLGLLSLALQRIDRHWKLGRAQQARLAIALDDAGVADGEILRQRAAEPGHALPASPPAPAGRASRRCEPRFRSTKRHACFKSGLPNLSYQRARNET